MGLFSGFLIHNFSGFIHFNDELDENIQLSKFIGISFLFLYKKLLQISVT